MEEKSEEKGGEPLIETVETGLLVGTAISGTAIAQAHTWVEPGGTLHKPCLVSSVDIDAIIGVFRPLVSSLDDKQTHRTEIQLEGDELTVSEDPEQVPGGTSLIVSLVDAGDYPRNTASMLAPDPTATVKVSGKLVEPSYGTGFQAEHLRMIAAVSRRRAMSVAVYRHHQSKPIIVEIGGAWRAAIQPHPLKEGDGQHLAPVVRVFDPELPAVKTPPKTEPIPEPV
jgi:hypothetical protein